MKHQTPEWLVYDRVDYTILGTGETRENALLGALETSNLMPGDFLVESFSDLDLSLDASVLVDNWVAATQEAYREDFEGMIAIRDGK